ncbi:UDP-glucose 4-epimerase GalE [Polynucleobacter sp. MWH-Spelu-300-X4]|uniref:UDP-glucose 4-epimerase GalE n=1 Tax=Polynucleobacter sp. MWH-Spelu-300-X4 TaxID=2689109 RepID=UPI001BFDC625|nr:UDP-glucose 4-epimerase GalE [Polynucleobacter sp. MWH-Spelu-300-X4]QWD80068.1 UDP-glucose 4-epimerase GalE [Polynucleobacter sp. MWH-Spelu-300-X4]
MILLTGATGYIGSHTWVELINASHQVVGVDNFSNSNPKVLARIREITNQEPLLFEGDVRNTELLNQIFERYSIDAVIHFAALKAVGESVQKPIEYYQNNLGGLLTLTQVMRDKACSNFVFSSSATVYHPDNPIPYQEGMPLGSTSPYGWTKYMSEQMLRDVEVACPQWKVAYLRYFNPVGAHVSGLIGEDPRGVPNNLMPYVTQVAVGKREVLSVYGGDWPTHDGTGVRDYIHVVDLARGHVKAVNYLLAGKGSLTVNLGAGKGYSVLDLVKSFEQASNKTIPYQIVDRRPGDIAAFYADASLAKEKLDWAVEYDLNRMCEDSWRWQSMNPNGFID